MYKALTNYAYPPSEEDIIREFESRDAIDLLKSHFQTDQCLHQ